MAHVLVLENDREDQKKILQIVQKIQPDLQVQGFQNLTELLEWIKEIIGQDFKPESSKFQEIKQVQMIILKLDFLRARRLGIIYRFLQFLSRYGMNPESKPIPVLGTLSEIANIKIQRYFSPFIWNVTMKPFDDLILESQISMALEGRTIPKNHLITPYKTNALVELIKPIHLTHIATQGFRTETNRTLPLGVTCKYYGKIFSTDRIKSAVARVETCEEVKKYPQIGQVLLSFFGLEPTQVSKLRSHLQKSKALSSESSQSRNPQDFSWLILDRSPESINNIKALFKDTKSKKNRELHFTDFIRFKIESDFSSFLQEHKSSGLNPEKAQLIKFLPNEAFQFVDEKSVPPKLLKSLHNRRLTELCASSEKDRFIAWQKSAETEMVLAFEKIGPAVVFMLRKAGQTDFFLSRLEPLDLQKYFDRWSRIQKTPEVLFVSDEFVSLQDLEYWETFATDPNRSKSRIFLLSKRLYDDFDKIRLSKIFKDIFFLPLDQAYIKSKLFHLMDFLDFKTHLDIIESEEFHPIEVVHPVQIEELSEIGIIVKYDREVSLGSFREFVLLRSYAPSSLRIWGSCNATEKIADQEWRLHFVFYGTKDLERKEVRKWIHEHYVNQKEAEGS